MNLKAMIHDFGLVHVPNKHPNVLTVCLERYRACIGQPQANFPIVAMMAVADEGLMRQQFTEALSALTLREVMAPDSDTAH